MQFALEHKNKTKPTTLTKKRKNKQQQQQKLELYFDAFFKFLTISGRVATLVEIYQFVLNS